MYDYILITASVCVLLFGIIGMIDGAWFHLYKFRLFEHQQTKKEHILHTARAGLFVLILYALFLNDAHGILLWVGLGACLADIFVLFWDLLEEGDSRTNLGGLPHSEYIVHVLANTLHFIALVLVILGRPWTSWNIDASPLINRDAFIWVYYAGQALFGGAMFFFIIHLALVNRKFQILFNKILPH